MYASHGEYEALKDYEPTTYAQIEYISKKTMIVINSVIDTSIRIFLAKYGIVDIEYLKSKERDIIDYLLSLIEKSMIPMVSTISGYAHNSIKVSFEERTSYAIDTIHDISIVIEGRVITVHNDIRIEFFKNLYPIYELSELDPTKVLISIDYVQLNKKHVNITQKIETKQTKKD